jgi:glyoxylase-like metal-dependent hydrolase (beta-lactamase superfamily II)
MTEITPGIYWFKMPMPTDEAGLDYTNAYLIRGASGYLLVDVGWNTDAGFATLQKGMAAIGADVKEISQILVTHVHPDHYGMAGRIKKLSGASLAMHHIEEGFINSRYISMEGLINQIDRLLEANGVPAKIISTLSNATVGLERYVVTAYPDITLHDGETVTTGEFNFNVIWTPGHSSGHICLYEPEKKIFLSGDHILPSITPNVSVHPQAIENPLGRYLNSLKELKRLEVALVLPGHEKPFTNFRERIEEILQHHEQRNGEILVALGNRPGTSFQVAQEVRWGQEGSWHSLPDFHKRIAVLETLAHLEMMAADGRVDRLPGNEIMLFQKASPPR